jgi:hypothetical protein
VLFQLAAVSPSTSLSLSLSPLLILDPKRYRFNGEELSRELVIEWCRKGLGFEDESEGTSWKAQWERKESL